MCSIGEDDFGDEGGVHSMTQETPFSLLELQGTCNKCNQTGNIIQLCFREPECHQCFLMYVRHKFRATLGSSKVLPKGSRVLLIFDGSPESYVLLDMMHYAQSQDNFKRLHCTTRVLYIDILMLDEPSEQHKEKLRSIASFLRKYNLFEAFITPFSNNLEALTNLNDINKYLLLTDSHKEIKKSLNKIKSLTTRQDYIKNQRNNLIAGACSQLNCPFVFLPYISTNLATEILTDIVLGRGASVALDVSLVDDRFSGLKFVRPLKDLNEMEVKYYMQVQKLYPMISGSFGEKYGKSASLQNLTKSFVDNLQHSYASTVSTIFRTGDKLAHRPLLNQQIQRLTIDNKDESVQSICAFCNAKVDYFDSRTILATEFSRMVSQSRQSRDSCSTIETFSKSIMKNAEACEQLNFCHSCRNIMNEMPNKNLIL